MREERDLNQELPYENHCYARGIYKRIWKYGGRTGVFPKDEASERKH